MKVIRNRFIPFKGFRAMNVCGVLFARKEAKIDKKTLNHEQIHTAQMKELLYVFFYLWYVLEWIVRLFMKGNAYRSISFEREAYDNENNDRYLNERRKFAWLY
ncbi:hypothetical protein [Bacteroides neonati]|uniref:hypothetical protein n=1 Tax=Bacteroides neonati TaxID=1347393 RepID=UPI0004B52CC4|nr:hypothetical protein [Bacteroides neonati]